jgi:NAD(P)-dependent dehydrogenase (short-subunit alcohol dehydrogenase family)
MHIKDLFSLESHVALVIGGAGKIAFPMAEALGEAGAFVYIASTNEKNYTKAAETLQERGLAVEGIYLNMSDENSVANALDVIKSSRKTPDILINGACERPMTKFMDDDIDNWDRSMNVNSRGLFICCRTVGRAMVKQGGGSIINISSIYGLVAPNMKIYKGSSFETEPDYPFVKGGTIMFTKYLASYFASGGVRVNCIAPGGFFNDQPEPFLSNYIENVPMGRMAEYSDMKGVALFLASAASKYITGCVIPVDGGWTAQ